MNSSQQVKDDGIVIIGLGITANVNNEMLKTIASSKDQVLIFPDFTSPVKVDITGDLTAVICEGKYLLGHNQLLFPLLYFSFQSFQFLYIVRQVLRITESNWSCLLSPKKLQLIAWFV